MLLANENIIKVTVKEMYRVTLAFSEMLCFMQVDQQALATVFYLV